MNKNTRNASCFLFSFLIASNCFSQLEGDWMLTISHGVERLGVITFEDNNGDITEYSRNTE